MSQIEIERKFLAAAVPPGLLDTAVRQPIAQGYLAVEGEVEVRVRAVGADAVLTVKGGGGTVRTEVEVAVGPERFAALWPLTAGRRLEKLRHRVALGAAVLEVDVYGGVLEGLVVAEVEFPSMAAAAAFSPPSWLGAEVTGDERYRNANLARAAGPPAGEG